MAKESKLTGDSKKSGKITPTDKGRSFGETVARMRKENTASPDIARSKLQDMGILGRDGRLSNKYK